MEALSCRSCTAPLPVGKVDGGIKCEYCGTTNIEPRKPEVYIATVIGDGASAQGEHSTAVGAGGFYVGGRGKKG